MPIFNDKKKTITPTKGIKNLSFNPRTYRYHFAIGNIKMGRILSWSTLMSDYKLMNMPGVLRGISGTCGNCEGCVTSCYVRSEYRFPGVIMAHARNTYGLRNDIGKVQNDLAVQLTKSKIDIVRINQSGELESDDQLAMWIQLAIKFQKKHFYLYTKRYDIVARALDQDLVPDNLVILFSVWHEYGVNEFKKYMDRKNVKAFMYDDGDTRLDTNIYCAAYDEHGHLDHSHTCDSCKLCFKSAAKVIGCHAH